MKSYAHVPPVLSTDLPERQCAVCKLMLNPGEHYLELFRAESSEGARRMAFVHVACAVRALETWVKKKESHVNSVS